MENLFLTTESWVLVYVALAAVCLLVASIGKEGIKYVAWGILLSATIIFVCGFFFEEVRIFFYRLTH